MTSFYIFIGSFFTLALLSKGINFFIIKFNKLIDKSIALKDRQDLDEKMHRIHSWLFIKKNEWI